MWFVGCSYIQTYKHNLRLRPDKCPPHLHDYVPHAKVLGNDTGTDSMLKFEWFKSFYSRAGLGRKKGRDDEWIEHQDAFDQILAELNTKQGMQGGFTLHYLQNGLDATKGIYSFSIG